MLSSRRRSGASLACVIPRPNAQVLCDHLPHDARSNLICLRDNARVVSVSDCHTGRHPNKFQGVIVTTVSSLEKAALEMQSGAASEWTVGSKIRSQSAEPAACRQTQCHGKPSARCSTSPPTGCQSTLICHCSSDSQRPQQPEDEVYNPIKKEYCICKK